MNAVAHADPIVNAVGATWFEDLSTDYLNECLQVGINVVGCTANDTWDDTLESVENLQIVKQVVRENESAYVVEYLSDLVEGMNAGKIGVVLGLQNPKPLSDSMNFLEAFIDMGLRCCSLAFRDNSYYGCGFSSAIDSGLSEAGHRAIQVMNRRGVVIDLSHVGDRTALDAVEASDHPTIFSHSMARQMVMNEPKFEWGGLRNSTVLRAAPDDLIVAAAKKGGVICPDSRMARTFENYLAHIEYLVRLVGIDHVGLTAQDDWHRSAKDLKRVQPYLPGHDSKVGGKDRVLGNDYRIYRVEDQIGQKTFQSNAFVARLRQVYSDADVGKIVGGNLFRVLSNVLPA